MKCSEAKFNLAFYADGELAEPAAKLVGEHLRVCPVCRQTYAETVEIRSALRRMSRTEMPAALTQSIKYAAASERQKMRASWLPFSTELRDALRMRVLPYGVGVLATVVIGFGLLTVMFSPARDSGASFASSGSTTIMLASNRNPLASDDADSISPAEYARTRLAVAGESPSVNPNGALVALTKSLVRGDMKDDEVVVVADVFGNGLARIAEVVEPSRDRMAVEELRKALATDPEYAPFLPASLEKRPENMRVILRFQSVNVKTHQKSSR